MLESTRYASVPGMGSVQTPITAAQSPTTGYGFPFYVNRMNDEKAKPPYPAPN